MKDIDTIGLVGRRDDPRVGDTMVALARHLLRRDVEVIVHGDTGAIPPGCRRVDDDRLAAEAALVIAVGGDGTMLYAARLAAPHGIPLIGVNRGRLGFLADVGPDEMIDEIDAVLAGRFVRETRIMLRAQLGESVVDTGLNDVVVQRAGAGRMLDVETRINGVYVNTHGGDGLIIATPTGSTAYALSGGGPILAPSLHALVVVPICPHTLSDRPVVIAASDELEILLSERRGDHAEVSCDGRPLGAMRAGERLHVRLAGYTATLLHPPGYDYYRILRSKLSWGRGKG